MNVLDVVFSSEDSEQAIVGVIKLRKDNKWTSHLINFWLKQVMNET